MRRGGHLASTLLFFAVFSSCTNREETEKENALREAERLAAILESPDRQRWQMPERVIAELKLKKGDVVADIGAGTGYFARRFAEKVAPNGLSIGFDVNPALVEFMQRDAVARGLSNYQARLIASHNPALEKNYYDLIFFCNTYQHLENRVEYFKSLAESLKPKGRIVVIDFIRLEKTDEESGEVPENLVDKKTVVREFRQAGFKLRRDLRFLPSQYFLEFVRQR
ncbi:MAG: class I SAM-dependent methyltransferase [Turneriella sp.]|nr:class I SAM-dependent methyltransferase [Turneriella sp.]